MVVNLTTYTSLAKPTEDELALNWTRTADLIEDNNTIIEDESTLSLQAKTPLFIGRSGNPSVGAGSISMESIDFNGFVFGNCKLVFGAGAATGSNEWGVELPFQVNSTYHAVGTALDNAPGPLHCIGEGYFHDASAVGTSGSFAVDAVTIAGVSYARFISENFAGKTTRIIGSASPVAIASGDYISFNYVYKKA